MLTLKYEFLADEGEKDYYPHPIPAAKAIPAWYKNMPRSRHFITNEVKPTTTWVEEGVSRLANGATIKECIPVRDYLTSGYIIPMWFELALYKNEGNLEWGYTDEGPHNARISPHYPSQYMDTPLWNGKDNTKHIPKLKSPWGFKTPKGYSSFFFSPRYSDSLIEILPAIVDTDMHHEVNFPFVYKGEEGVQNKIELGTPIIQVIPFKRQDWASSVSEKEYRKRGKFRAYLSQAYLKLHHSKKRYR